MERLEVGALREEGLQAEVAHVAAAEELQREQRRQPPRHLRHAAVGDEVAPLEAQPREVAKVGGDVLDVLVGGARVGEVEVGEHRVPPAQAVERRAERGRAQGDLGHGERHDRRAEDGGELAADGGECEQRRGR